MISCSWKEEFGIDCMMCGSQRSFLSLIHGDIYESLTLFPATIPLVFTFLLLISHLILKFKRGAQMITISFSLSAVLILFSFSFKLEHYFFN